MLNQFTIDFVPGPGHYCPSIGFDSIAEQRKYISELQKIGVDKSCYIKPASIFLSKISRISFQNPQKAYLPGPGAYNTARKWDAATTKIMGKSSSCEKI
jgi:hypothetical protein